jgi:hypothetical protein
MWFGIVELTTIRQSPERNLTPWGLTAFRQGRPAARAFRGRSRRIAPAGSPADTPAVAVISDGHDANMTFACSLGTKFAKMDAQA